MTSKKIVYIDMDGVLVDLVNAVYQNNVHALGDDSFDIGAAIDNDVMSFYNAKPIKGAVKAFQELSKDERFDVYILSTAPWANPESLTAKRVWVETHLGEAANRRLILSHHKNLMIGDYLIDDRPNNGAAEFKGELIKFGNDQYPDWASVLLKLEQDVSNN